MSRKRQTTLTGSTPISTRTRVTERNSFLALEDELPEEQSQEAPKTGTPVTMESIQELINVMQANIRRDTEEIIGELRKDVNNLKERIDSSNDRFEEAENRISNIEDRLYDIEENNSDTEELKSTLKVAIANYNIDACRARTNNVIVHGLPVKSKDTKVAMKTLNNLCTETMKMSQEWFDKADIKETYRFPAKKTTDPWPLFVSFNKTAYREEFYRNAPKLKGTGIVISNDLAPCLIVEKKRLQKIGDSL